MTKAYDDEPRRGPLALTPMADAYEVRGSVIPPSGPADPRQRVRNDRRTPEPYRDLIVTPNLTGTYFEKDGRYRLFIDHAGEHLECLFTLVVKDSLYHHPILSPKGRGKKAPRLSADERLPFDWGIAGYLGRPPSRRRDPIAFRFAGDHESGVYLLRVPIWLGHARIDPSNPGDGTYDLGFLQVDGDGDEIRPSFRGWFVDRWPEADKTFGISGVVPMLDTVAVRASREPVLLDRYLSRTSVPFHVRTRYWFPPTPTQTDRIGQLARGLVNKVVEVNPAGYRLRKGGKKMDLYDLLQAERTLGMTHPHTFHRDQLIGAIDALVAKVYDEALATPVQNGGLTASDLDELRVPILQVLDAWMLLPSDGHGKQSLGTALQRAVDRASATATTTTLGGRLGIKPRGWRKFQYEIETQAWKLVEFQDKQAQKKLEIAKKVFKKLKKALDKVLDEKSPTYKKLRKIMKFVPLTYLVVHVHVKYLGVIEGDSGGPADDPWEADYLLLLGGINPKLVLGDGTSAKMSGLTDLWASTPPAPHDLEGTMWYGEGSVFGGAHIKADKGEIDASVVKSKSMMTFYGSSQEPAVSFFFESQMSDGKGGLGLHGKGLFGQAILADNSASHIQLEPEDDKEEQEFQAYWSRHIPSLAVHFPTNGARLPVPTEEELELMEQEGLLAVKDALNAFAACELPLFMNPFTEITLDGYADPPDEPEPNRELSRNRARSVVNYLQSILGDIFTFGVTEEIQEDNWSYSMGRIRWKGHGEPRSPSPPRKARSEPSDPQQRRCDVILELRVPDAGSETSIDWSIQGNGPSPRKEE